MDLTISIPSEAETRLQQQAAEAGVSVEAFAARIVRQAVESPSLSELLVPVRADLSGIPEDQWREMGKGAIAEVRARKAADNGGGGRKA